MEGLNARDVGLVVVVAVVVELSLESKMGVSKGPVVGVEVDIENVRSAKNVSKANSLVSIKNNTHSVIQGEIFRQVGIVTGILWS